MKSEDWQAISGLLIVSLLIMLVVIAGLFALPIAVAGAIGLWAWRKYSEPTYNDLVQLHEQIQAVAPPSTTDFQNAVHAEYQNKGYDLTLDYIVGEIYEMEGLAQPPEYPKILNPITAARFRDQAADYINKAENSDLLPAVLEAIRPLLLTKRSSGILEGTRPLEKKDVEWLHMDWQHPTYFKKLHSRLVDNKQYAKEPADYIRDTPFEHLLDRPINVNLTNRFEHCHVLGGSGAGKTNLIEYLIENDLKTDCTVIVIDNQRQMIPKLARAGYDMQYIKPSYPLALNLFDLPDDHHTAPLLQYVLSGMMNAPLTPKQELIFQFGVTLMLATKGNINDFQRLLDGDTFDLSNVDDTTRRFFETEYYTREYQSTRKEISWRIWALLKNPTLRDMFAAKENRCALETDRQLILIDCDVHLLQDYSGMFGRFFLAQLMQLSQKRFVGQHRPIYVYIDEAYVYLDQSVTTMLETARKARVGLTMAHQYLDQITEPKVRAALMSLTSTKFAAQLSPSDAHSMAQAMHINREYIDNLKKWHFALWQRGEGTVAVSARQPNFQDIPFDEAEMVSRYCRREPPPIVREPVSTYDDVDIEPSSTL